MQKIKIPEMITNCIDKKKSEAIYNNIAINSSMNGAHAEQIHVYIM